MTEDQVIAEAIKMFGCDSARITSPCGTHFLIIGWQKNTRVEREAGRSQGQWTENGKPFDFDYTDEKAIASGDTMEKLMESAKYYKGLLDKEAKLWANSCVSTTIGSCLIGPP